MPKITILKGLPYSGKTEEAEKIIKESDTAVRFSYKEYITMLGSSNGHVVDMWGKKSFRILLDLFLVKELDIIIDDCNLDKEELDSLKAYIKNSIKVLNLKHKIEIKDMKLNVFKCIDNAKAKGYNHHIPYIVNTALKYGKYPKPKLPFVLYEVKTKEQIEKDMSKLLDYAQNKYDIIAVSTRPESEKSEVDKLMAESGMFFKLPINTLILNWSKQSEKVYFKDKSWIIPFKSSSKKVALK